MPSQTIRCLTSNEIERNLREMQSQTSVEYYKHALEIMQKKFDLIVKDALAGETIVVVDQWGKSVSLEMSKTDEPT